MNARPGIFSSGLSFPLIVLLMLPWSVAAQTAPASDSSSATTPAMPMAGMDHGHMTDMPASSTDARKSLTAKPETKSANGEPAKGATTMGGAHDMHHDTMSGTHTEATMDSTHNGAVHDTDHTSHAQDASSAMSMGSMQGGSAPPGARSPDYSDGVGYGSMNAHLAGNDAIGKLLIDQLEVFDGRDGHGQSWELGGWYGSDENKLWIRSEGERSAGKVQDGDAEVLWNHAIAAYWGTQLGVRHDFGVGPGRSWAAFGVEGLAPYWFELEATGYAGSSGRTAARFRINHDVLFTQRLILTPELEANLYGRNDPARGIGSGLSDIQLGLRLRYEIRREFAPYIGINWIRRFGNTAEYARAEGEHTLDRQIVAGLRIWF
ncbi:MAG: copper resistance protein B [Rhodanobacter sp.]